MKERHKVFNTADEAGSPLLLVIDGNLHITTDSTKGKHIEWDHALDMIRFILDNHPSTKSK